MQTRLTAFSNKLGQRVEGDGTEGKVDMHIKVPF
jgi:hypothetical protein